MNTFYCPDVNFYGVAARVWCEFVDRPLTDFIERKITPEDYVKEMDEVPTILAHWGSHHTLQEMMEYYLKEKVYDAKF